MSLDKYNRYENYSGSDSSSDSGSDSDIDYELIAKQYDYSGNYVHSLWTKFVYSPIELLGYEGKGKMVSLRRGYWTDYQWDDKYECIRSISLKNDLYSLDEEQRAYTPQISFDFIRFFKMDGSSQEFSRIIKEKGFPLELEVYIHSFVNTCYNSNLLCMWEKM
jgi:hypothetical protein